LNAGVRGLVPRSAESAEVVEAIVRTHRDRAYLHPSLEPMAAGRTGENGPRRALSRREFEVLHLVADGLENQSVADELYLSVETVRTHIKNILRKLQARDRTHAVSLAYRAGLLAPHLPPSPRRAATLER
jgi:DNA-binding NarL/FixJ family response regulator